MRQALIELRSLASPFIFPTSARPKWHLGFGMNLGFSCAAILTTLFMILYYKMENARRDEREGGAPVAGQRVDQANLHDLAPGFRYTL